MFRGRANGGRMKEFTIKAEPLLRCPFCGGEMEIIHIGPLSPLLKDEYHFACKNMCITSRKSYETEIEAIKSCNTRKPMERILERLEECKETHDRRLLSKKETASFKIKELQFSGCYQNAIEIVKEEGGIE